VDPYQPLEVRPRRTLSKDELRISIARDVSRLLNTRCAYSLDELEGLERTVLEYGLPDLSNYHATNQDDQPRLAEAVRQAVAAYEPRLADIAVEVLRVDPQSRALTVAVAGLARTGKALLEPVSFVVAIHAAEQPSEEPRPDAAAG